MATPKKRDKAPSRRGKVAGNGLNSFAMHVFDAKTSPLLAKLSEERKTSLAYGFVGPTDVSQLDPETVAKRYLHEAMASRSVPALSAPKPSGVESDFKSLGTETVPLTNTTTVKFRQTLSGIPVYGSLITVELDDSNSLVSLNSSVGSPDKVSAVAQISPADAIKAVEKYSGYNKNLDGIVPLLHYYFDQSGGKWRLVFILEGVPVTPKEMKGKSFPRLMDYVVDARTGTVVSEIPRSPSVTASSETAVDGLGVSRSFGVVSTGSKKLMQDTSLNVQTFDFNFKDPKLNEKRLPGSAIQSPPKWSPAAVSAHANAAAVADFLRKSLMRNNIDNKGGPMNSSINCVVAAESSDGKQWFNAFWNGKQMVYGQRLKGSDLMSLSIKLDVVGHEMFHGVTESTAGLEYSNQSGALNESYSDIFGVIIANFSNPNTLKWNWLVGDGLSPDGRAFRDLSDPTKCNQPAHMKDFKVSANTSNGDYGGVHRNSGIHNKAAFNILTALDSATQLIFTAQQVAAFFYLALTQRLSRTSQFIDSRTNVLLSARTLFRSLADPEKAQKIAAIEKGFDDVGIK